MEQNFVALIILLVLVATAMATYGQVKTEGGVSAASTAQGRG